VILFDYPFTGWAITQNHWATFGMPLLLTGCS